MIKERNIVLAIVLSLVTFGLYGIYWQISLSNDLVKATNGEKFSTSGIVALLLTMVTFGIYGLYWTYKMGECAGATKGSNDGILYLILSFFGLGVIVMVLGQSDVNKVAAKA